MVIWGINESCFPSTGYCLSVLCAAGSCTSFCVLAVETIVESCPTTDLNCSRTWEPQLEPQLLGFTDIDLEYVHECFNLGLVHLLAVLCLTLKSTLGSVQIKNSLEKALSRNLSNALQQLMGAWSVGCSCSWAGQAVLARRWLSPLCPPSRCCPIVTGTGIVKDSRNICSVCCLTVAIWDVRLWW